MLLTNANSSQSIPNPQTQYQIFLGRLNNGPKGQAQWFEPERPPILESNRITFYLIATTPPGVIGHLQGHLVPLILKAARHPEAWGQAAPGDVAYVVSEAAASKEMEIHWPQEEDEPDDYDNDPDEYQGVYHNPEDAIIQPAQKEYNQATQYYRKKWRPLLGPTLSELIRELRQRCHYKSKRDKFLTTYKSLAAALGVSERTVKRALARDKEGRFANEHLNYFIADIQVIRESKGKGEIRTKGTRFLIYLTDTLTPDDRTKLDNLRKGQNGT